jgi:hypothetical protein
MAFYRESLTKCLKMLSPNLNSLTEHEKELIENLTIPFGYIDYSSLYKDKKEMKLDFLDQSET